MYRKEGLNTKERMLIEVSKLCTERDELTYCKNIPYRFLTTFVVHDKCSDYKLDRDIMTDGLAASK